MKRFQISLRDGGQFTVLANEYQDFGDMTVFFFDLERIVEIESSMIGNISEI